MSVSKRSSNVFTGKVIKQVVLPGSKNEHMAHVLKAGDGVHRLKRIGSNPYYDDYFDQFIGKEVEIEGTKKISYLQVHSIKEKK